MTVQSFESELAGLIARLDGKARRQLAREIAKQLRQSQQKRIAAQLNPDGSAFAPRKPQVRNKQGTIRRTMFSKLRTARWLKAEATADAAVVGFVRQVGKLAAVHQYGLRDKASTRGPEVKYATRELLGYTSIEIEAITRAVLVHIAN